jgi:rhodanese-related sulfurtransferase
MRTNQRRGLQILWECLAVTAVGTLLALTANALHPQGVRLGRNYFPRRTPPAISAPVQADADKRSSADDPLDDTPPPAAATVPDAFSQSALDRIADHIEQQGFQVIRHDAVVALFNNPLTRDGFNIFIDARNDRAYTVGHIPGAYQLDHYHIEDYIDQVLPACMSALTIVVYCSGGECEDSEFTALELFDRGVDPSRIFVYPGGMSLWKHSGMPVEIGARDSGRIIGQDLSSPAERSDDGGSP